MAENEKEGKENMKENDKDGKGIIDLTEIDSIVNEIIDQAPDCTISENVNTNDNIEGGNDNTAFNAVDFKGRSFDKNLHWVNDDGVPLLNKNGTLRTKRKSKKQEQAQEQEVDSKKMTIEHTGRILAQYTIAISAGLFGKEFLPNKNEEIDEMALMSDAYTQYLATKNIENVPPSVVLLGCLSMYFLPRLTQTVVQEKITGKFKKIYRKIMRK